MISIEALLCRITPLQAYLPFILVMFCHWAEQHCLPEKLSTPETRKLVVGHGLHSEHLVTTFNMVYLTPTISTGNVCRFSLTR